MGNASPSRLLIRLFTFDFNINYSISSDGNSLVKAPSNAGIGYNYEFLTAFPILFTHSRINFPSSSYCPEPRIEARKKHWGLDIGFYMR